MKFSLTIIVIFALVSLSVAQDCKRIREIAQAGTKSFGSKFYSNGKLSEKWPNTGKLTGYWTHALTIDVWLDSVITNNEKNGWDHYDEIWSLYQSQIKHHGLIVDFQDDLAWMGAAMVRAHHLALKKKDAKKAEIYLNDAKKLWQYISGWWDETCCGDHKGGIWWDKKKSQKATAANGGHAILSMELYEVTKERKYLDWAMMVYNFWRKHMTRVDKDGFVCDHFNQKEKNCNWSFTYNMGLMLGASTMLWKETKNQDYHDNANQYAKSLIAMKTVKSPYGLVLNDGTDKGCLGDCQDFKGPTVRYMKYFYETMKAHDSKNPLIEEVYKVLKSSIQSLINSGRDAKTETYATSWTGPKPDGKSAEHGKMVSAVMSLHLFSQICK